jgi:hypothetical protein
MVRSEATARGQRGPAPATPAPPGRRPGYGGGVARLRSQMAYVLACGQCGDGADAQVFWSLGARIDWMRAHAEVTGHDGYIVQDVPRLMVEGHCPVCNTPMVADTDRPTGRDDHGDEWPARRCDTHGAWGERPDGQLVPVTGT